MPASTKDSWDMEEVMQIALDRVGCRNTPMVNAIGGYLEDGAPEYKVGTKDN